MNSKKAQLAEMTLGYWQLLDRADAICRKNERLKDWAKVAENAEAMLKEIESLKAEGETLKVFL